ncbi:hypothetical protein GUJ93_ZPchr0007g4351 [Zizania palustris]|uniref:Uncharacterized protein n=1 Tax=Zizania palustris TaxID=103762 RepID=A0A8J5THM9_ZIZPA|nr:hypothetical protein GUJ93_ZPchr0007g4351 [Zizania palustris]
MPPPTCCCPSPPPRLTLSFSFQHRPIPPIAASSPLTATGSLPPIATAPPQHAYLVSIGSAIVDGDKMAAEASFSQHAAAQESRCDVLKKKS